ncbi:hypothetical protein [Halpernia frigidisoli]|uniref:Bacteriocin n=1 Tax=Halpernia frigidisoli TaxID=1125876 RepID=A0A1I3I3Q3_9FLAO|nr:hypothetical protein [Halpernia frigidisoli]SFI42615.1 hypothetical protein SAMN05443292_2546 [Halpernia frigidisoli]
MKKIIFGSFLALAVSTSAFAKTSEVKNVNLQETTSVNFLNLSKAEAQTFVGNNGQTYFMLSDDDGPNDRWYCNLAGAIAEAAAIKLGVGAAGAAAIGLSTTAGCTAIFGGKPQPAALTPA